MELKPSWSGMRIFLKDMGYVQTALMTWKGRAMIAFAQERIACRCVKHPAIFPFVLGMPCWTRGLPLQNG